MKQLPAALNANLALSTYRDDPDWMFKTGLGGVLNAACLLLCVLDMPRFIFAPVGLAFAALVTGYLLRASHNRLQDPGGKLPDWGNWGDLFMSGMTWVALQFCHLVLATIPITVVLLIASFVIAAFNANEAAMFAVIAVIGITLLGTFLFWHLFISYLTLNFATEDKLLSGFAYAKVVRYIWAAPRQLLTAWVLAFELQVIAVLVPTLTILGVFIVPSTLFAAQLVGLSILAQAWRAVDEAEKFTAQPLSSNDAPK